MTYTEQQEWDKAYAEGQGFRQLGDRERAALAAASSVAPASSSVAAVAVA
ncbi:hypothetical protein ABT300_12520 [Streptomyces sp. NPDC001027]